MEDLIVTFQFRIDSFDYVVFASSETMKCVDMESANTKGNDAGLRDKKL